MRTVQVYLFLDHPIKKPDPAFLKLVIEKDNFDINETTMICKNLLIEIAIT